ncbi:MAG TPA: c-type cytochrome [Bacteroidia bacterium]|nr:c-type cytochrome [Bacteroidia bacterium]
MKKWQISLLLMIAVFVGIGATTTNSGKPEEEGFKNLQILPKDISEKELHKVMREYSVSLGVHCGFCNASWSDTTKRGLDFASDTKDEKKIARHMMQMTTSINSTYFNFNNSTKPDTIHMVMCFTCHRGHSQPDEKSTRAQMDTLMSQMMKKRN